jgi:hypothetical protein
VPTNHAVITCTCHEYSMAGEEELTDGGSTYFLWKYHIN